MENGMVRKTPALNLKAKFRAVSRELRARWEGARASGRHSVEKDLRTEGYCANSWHACCRRSSGCRGTRWYRRRARWAGSPETAKRSSASPLTRGACATLATPFGGPAGTGDFATIDPGPALDIPRGVAAIDLTVGVGGCRLE